MSRVTVPVEPGRLLQIPPLREWPEVVVRRGLVADRQDLLRRAREFSSLYDMSFQEGKSGLLIMSGHQPGFVHPGIWVKQFVLDGIADALDATSVHLQVDSDLPAPLSPPLLLPGPRRERIPYYSPPGGKPFESLTAPPRLEWDAFVEQLRTQAVPSLLPGIERLAEAGQATWDRLGPEPSLGLFLDLLRRTYEQPRRYLELPVSVLCGTTGFLYFVAEVLQHLESFHRAYNGNLAHYRVAHKVRSKANPIPDLRHRADATEAPFWVVDAQGIRRGLWMQEDGTLLAREVPVGRFDGTVESLAGLALRPRALTLTLYCRRFLCDLFIHGVGGARYDTITNGIFEDFWGMTAPPFACISVSMAPVADATPPDVAATRHALRDLTHNPQRFVSQAPPALALAEEKARLVERIRATARHQQRPLAQEIRQVNARLGELLSDQRTALVERLSREEQALEAYRIATARDYPYFCFNPDDVRRLVAPALPVKMPF